MKHVEVRFLVDNFSVDNPAQVEALYEHFDASAARICHSTVVTLTVEVPDGASNVSQIRLMVSHLERLVQLRTVDVDLDLVDEGEIADRLGVSRQAVNLLANGARGHSFPLPYALPGGRRIWTWASVVRWVRQHRPAWDLDSGMEQLTREEQRAVSAWLYERSAAPTVGTFTMVQALSTCVYWPKPARIQPVQTEPWRDLVLRQRVG